LPTGTTPSVGGVGSPARPSSALPATRRRPAEGQYVGSPTQGLLMSPLRSAGGAVGPGTAAASPGPPVRYSAWPLAVDTGPPPGAGRVSSAARAKATVPARASPLSRTRSSDTGEGGEGRGGGGGAWGWGPEGIGGAEVAAAAMHGDSRPRRTRSPQHLDYKGTTVDEGTGRPSLALSDRSEQWRSPKGALCPVSGHALSPTLHGPCVRDVRASCSVCEH
jgi:hypothetical protein